MSPSSLPPHQPLPLPRAPHDLHQRAPRKSAVPVIVRRATRHVPKSHSAPDWKDSGAAPPVFYRLAAGTRFLRRNFPVALRLATKLWSCEPYLRKYPRRVCGKIQVDCFKIPQGRWKSQDPGGKVGTLCLEAEEYCSKRWPTAFPSHPAPTGFPRPWSGGAGPDRETEAGGAPRAGGPTSPGVLAPSSSLRGARCHRGRHPPHCTGGASGDSARLNSDGKRVFLIWQWRAAWPLARALNTHSDSKSVKVARKVGHPARPGKPGSPHWAGRARTGGGICRRQLYLFLPCCLRSSLALFQITPLIFHSCEECLIKIILNFCKWIIAKEESFFLTMKTFKWMLLTSTTPCCFGTIGFDSGLYRSVFKDWALIAYS